MTMAAANSIGNFDEDVRETMIASQLRPSKVSDPALLAVIRGVDRTAFVPEERQALAYADDHVPVGGGRMLLAPLAFARLVVAADVRAGEKVLDIAGLGYGAAVLAGLGAQVTSLECDATLSARASAGAAGGAIRHVTGPLAAGHAQGAPYDVILVEGAMGQVPQALVDQLTPGGRLVGLLAEGGVTRIIVAKRSGNGVGILPVFEIGAPLLPGFEREAAFAF